MATQDYLPKEDVKFNDFQANLKTFIDAHTPATPSPWGYAQARVDILTTKKNRWDAAWAIAKIKTTRTPSDVLEKKLARKDYEKEIRQFVKEFLKNNLIITDEQRLEMQIPPNDTTPTRVPVPTTVPLCEPKRGSGTQILIIFKQEGEEPGTSKRGKPKGVERMDIRYKIDGAAPTNQGQCPEADSAKRSPKRINFDAGLSGKRVYFFVRWVNTRDEGGPWIDEAISIIIP